MLCRTVLTPVVAFGTKTRVWIGALRMVERAAREEVSLVG